MGSFLLKNIEIITALIAMGGIGLYMCFKDKVAEVEDNDLTYLIIEQKRAQKEIESQVEEKVFSFFK